ncbi:type I restriction endonuclease [Luteolibacter luteus]|uniref:Restriction endonuclease n=1 Tax=Luteolibacter luteus TaxID=2728835 RepID=A0A858RKQ9_9BACT|nr:type I restriction endonuclease [Luteolibacter luteus]QJE97517.1 restriction endonuclease [Luteolibacter luteus]
MDLADHLLQIASRIPAQIQHLQTEEATKNALVLPFLNGLGYNVFDPTEVIPEFIADVGTKKGEKVDYVIMKDGKPCLLIECKPVGAKLHINHASQLFRYFSVTDARFAILTNGVDYQFYTDIEAPNKMDEKPFFELSMLSLDSRTIEEVRKFSKTVFNLEAILSTASELKYKKQILLLLAKELEAPSEDLVRHFAKQVHGGVFSPAIKSQFTSLVGDAFRDFIKGRVAQRLQSALDDNTPAPGTSLPRVTEPIAENGEEEIITTQEEKEAFQIVRAILSKHVQPARVVMRDTKSYCGVLLDDNNRKPICRLRFNYSQKYLGLFDAQKNEEKFPLNVPLDIFKFEDRLIEAVTNYDTKKSESEDVASA